MFQNIRRVNRGEGSGVMQIAFARRVVKRDRIEKKVPYEQSSIVEYWIVDPENRSIEVFALTKDV